MKLTAHIPSNVRLGDVCAAMRSLGLSITYRDGELIAGREERRSAEVVPFPGGSFLPPDWPGKPAA